MTTITDADHARLRQYLTARARMVFDGTTEPHTTLLLETFARHRETALEELKDPHMVHVNMLRGTIAKPSARSIWHIYGQSLAHEMPTEIRRGIQNAALEEAAKEIERLKAVLASIDRAWINDGNSHADEYDEYKDGYGDGLGYAAKIARNGLKL